MNNDINKELEGAVIGVELAGGQADVPETPPVSGQLDLPPDEEREFVQFANERFAEAEKPPADIPPENAANTQAEEKKPAEAPAPEKKTESKPEEKTAAPPAETPEGDEEPAATHISDREVMAHTASIWQYREIASDGTEQHTEFHKKRTVTPFAEIIAARARGKKHKHEGTNCDDFFETAHTDDCAICVVCDGAGSKPLSRIGSRISAETAAAFLKEKMVELFVTSPELKPGLSGDMSAPEFMDGCMKIARLVQESARQAFLAVAEKQAELAADEVYISALGRPPVLSDLSATFLAAVIVPLSVDGKRQSFMAAVQIGDGCICAIDSNADAEHCFRLMGDADSGKFSGETDFLSEKTTQPDSLAKRTRVSRGSSDTILLMTDGVADDYFPAQPMMKRLYLDLCLNGILPMKGELTAGEDPAPVFYSSVSMSRRSIALQYAKQLLSDGSEEEMNALWEKRDMLRCHSLEAFRMNIGDTPEERLLVWLDNYNERGSFDDRTLALIRMK